MTKSATEVMQEIIAAAVLDSIDALKKASKGMPNTLLRDLAAIHANAAFADLPKELQAAILTHVRSAFNRLLKEGYAVAPAGAQPPQPRPGRERRPPNPENERRGPRAADPSRAPGAARRPDRPAMPGRPPRKAGPPRKPKS
jgi:hypothetical protein